MRGGFGGKRFRGRGVCGGWGVLQKALEPSVRENESGVLRFGAYAQVSPHLWLGVLLLLMGPVP